MNKGYMCYVTEYERGWGQRPDGILISLEKLGDVGVVWGNEACYGHADEWRMCELTEAGKLLIEGMGKPYVFIDCKSVPNHYVKEV